MIKNKDFYLYKTLQYYDNGYVMLGSKIGVDVYVTLTA